MLNLVKKISLLSALSLFVLTLTSCQDIIFDTIRKEVALEDSSIAGDIRSVVRFKDYFYLANGKIYYKSNTANYYGAWNQAPRPGSYAIKLAADNDNIYALVGSTVKDEDEGYNVGATRALYSSTDGSSWTLVKDLGYSSSVSVYLFCTNTIAEGNRKAFINYNGTVYELSGDTFPTTEKTTGETNASTTPTSSSKSCASLGGTVYFFNSYAAATNETSSADGTIYYYGDGSNIAWGKDGTQSGSVGSTATVLSLGVTGDYILAGTSSGICHHALSADGVPGKESTDFATNAYSTLSTAYEILSILVVNPENSETQTAIYATQVYEGSGSSNSAQFDHIGLWAYYPSRGNWNRE